MNQFVTIGGIAYNFIIIAVCTIFIFMRRRRRQAQEDFMFGGKQMGWFAIAASIALTALGGGHINGLSFQSWVDGVGVIWYCFGAGLCLVIVMRFTGVWYRRSGCFTVNEMFGKLFAPVLTPILAGFTIGYCWLILCVETQGLASVISALTGLPNLTSGVVGILIGVLYVLLAGIEEVGLVNSVNAILMYVFGFIALGVIGICVPNGWVGINNSLVVNTPELVAAFGNAEIIRSYIIGTFLSLALGMNFIQSNCQAVASADDLRVMRKAGIGAVVMNVMFGVIIIGFGLAALGLKQQGYIGAEMGIAGMMEMILTFFPPWLQICVVGMFAAAMLSTISMVALTIALSLNKEVLGHFKAFKGMSQKKEGTLARVWIVLAGLTAAIAAVNIKDAVNTTITWGFSWFIPLFFMFLIGLYWKRSTVAAMVTIFACWACNLALSFTNMAAKFNLEGNNHSIFLVVISLVLGLLITGLDKNAKPSFKKLYKEQRAAYDAARAK